MITRPAEIDSFRDINNGFIKYKTGTNAINNKQLKFTKSNKELHLHNQM